MIAPHDMQSPQQLFCSLDEQGDRLTGACCLAENPEFMGWADTEHKAGLRVVRMSIEAFIDRLDDEGFDIDKLLECLESGGMKVH